ncbi:hypothetical protein D5S17_23420 [Pseudonocardiaceae bacterium YIM PH 21723]|nr:hypothetical protein D5S17_23420 [Pseudonocardiaceae bacterium YIM PH 21723]
MNQLQEQVRPEQMLLLIGAVDCLCTATQNQAEGAPDGDLQVTRAQKLLDEIKDGSTNAELRKLSAHLSGVITDTVRSLLNIEQ